MSERSDPSRPDDVESADPVPSADPADPAECEQKARRQRKRIAELFGEVLPESTQDDTAREHSGERPGFDERWYRENRPPHHG